MAAVRVAPGVRGLLHVAAFGALAVVLIAPRDVAISATTPQPAHPGTSSHGTTPANRTKPKPPAQQRGTAPQQKRQVGKQGTSTTSGSQPATPTPPPPTIPFPAGLAYALGAVGTVLLAIPLALLVRFRRKVSASPSGSALLATLPALAVIGFALIPFSPHLGAGRWVPVEVLGVGLLLVGAAFGYVYGLPVADPEALSKGGTAAGTFLRPSAKLDKVIDAILPALTGGVVAFALTQAGHFNAVFLRLSGIPSDSPSRLLGIAAMTYFPTIGFMLAYTLMNTIGSLAFKRAEEALVLQVSIVQSFRSFPDIPVDPTPEQTVAAKEIIAVPYTIVSSAQKADWGRAQALLGNYADAERAFRDAIALDTQNPSLYVDFATAIYNDPGIDNAPDVLELLNQAKKFAGVSPSAELQRRMNALRAAVLLYIPGRYEEVITLVNGWIASSVSTSRFARFYRACAFGQLYESYAPAIVPNPLPAGAGPSGIVLPTQDAQALKALVNRDVALTLVAARETGRTNVIMVTDPTSKDRMRPEDDDLQTLAADDAALCTQIGLNAPPVPAPAPHPPPPTGMVPNPLTTPAGTLAAWIQANCPL